MLAIKILLLGGLFMAFSMGLPPVSEAAADNPRVAMETSRYLIYEAAWMESEGIDCTKEASMAKAYVNESYKYVTKWAIRLHGGIGTSRDHDIPLYHRRAKAADTAFGSTAYHRELVAQKIGL